MTAPDKVQPSQIRVSLDIEDMAPKKNKCSTNCCFPVKVKKHKGGVDGPPSADVVKIQKAMGILYSS